MIEVKGGNYNLKVLERHLTADLRMDLLFYAVVLENSFAVRQCIAWESLQPVHFALLQLEKVLSEICFMSMFMPLFYNMVAVFNPGLFPPHLFQFCFFPMQEPGETSLSAFLSQ